MVFLSLLYFVCPFKYVPLNTEEIPDDKRIIFMRKYPPILWKDKPGSAKLLEQCEGAASASYEAAKAKGLWKGAAKEEFKRYTQGLEIKTED